MPRHDKVAARQRRKRSIRKKVNGTSERPRMSVFRSNKHIYVQVVDDSTGRTLVSASTRSPEVREACTGSKKVDAARKVGALAAERCKAANVSKVVFDRNGFIYTGRVAAVADAAREGGIDF